MALSRIILGGEAMIFEGGRLKKLYKMCRSLFICIFVAILFVSKIGTLSEWMGGRAF